MKFNITNDTAKLSGVDDTCAGSCEPCSRYRPNECIFGGGKPRGSGFWNEGLMSKDREMGSSVYKQSETEVDGSCHS